MIRQWFIEVTPYRTLCYIDFGVLKSIDHNPISILSILTSSVQRDFSFWQGCGYMVEATQDALEDEITNHLSSPNIIGYVYVGHGDGLSDIGTYSSNGPVGGASPDRYTQFGIRFIDLYACDSADKQPIGGHSYTYNSWESNIAARGWFLGFNGSINTLDYLFSRRFTHGKNDNPND